MSTETNPATVPNPAAFGSTAAAQQQPTSKATTKIELSEKDEENMHLITRGLQEVLGEDIMRAKLAKGERLTCYWGTATTGKPHVGYFVPLTKLADFLRAGVEVKILLADIHAFLDAGKATYEVVGHRVAYYSKVLHAVLKSLGVPVENLKFVTGSTYQLQPDYNLDQYRLCAMTTLRDAMHAGAEVVKQSDAPQLSSLLYPGLQALDEQYLDVDFQFGGVDQRKIFIMAEKVLPRLGYRRRAHLMNAMVPGLTGGKMSSSDPNSKIDFLDSAKDVQKKISKAFCEKGNIENNGLLAFMKAVVFPIQTLRRQQMVMSGMDPESAENRSQCRIKADAPAGTLISIDRPEKYGGPIHYSTYEEMEQSFASDALGPPDLKMCVVEHVNTLLEPIRAAFESDEEFAKIRALAYPEEAPAPAKQPKKQQQEKKQKASNKGKDASSSVEGVTQGVEQVAVSADSLAAQSKEAAKQDADVKASEATSII